MAVQRRLLTVCLLAVLCGFSALPLAAVAKRKPKPGYATGMYAGVVSQPAPVPGTWKIHFVASRAGLSGLTMQVAEMCGGLVWTAVTDAPRSVRIAVSGSGSFSYDKTAGGDHLQIRGRLRGSQAAGILFDSLTSGRLVCTMGHAVPFSAQR